MVRIDKLLLGYVTVSFDEQNRREVMNRVIGASLSASFSEKNFFEVGVFSLSKYKKALSPIPVRFSELRGIPGYLFSLRKRYGLLLAFALLIGYYLLVGSFVWDVRVEGNEEVSQYEIAAELREAWL